MARPKTIIDWEQVDELLQAHCDGMSIAGLLGIHYNTFYNAVKERYNCDFSEYSQKKKGEGVSLMELSIYQDAIKRGGIDRIFWLKNKAGWKDQSQIDHTNNGNSFSNLSDAELITIAAKLLGSKSQE